MAGRNLRLTANKRLSPISKELIPRLEADGKIRVRFGR